MELHDLIEKVAQSTGYDEEELVPIVEELVDVISTELLNGDTVRVRGLGTFRWEYRKQSRRRNPKTGEWVDVPEKQVLKFRPVPLLKYREVE